MYVPNYIPPPIEVPGNVAEESHRVRLGFVRRVAVLHFLGLLLVGALSRLNLPAVPLETSLIQLGILLVVLCLVRIGTRATRYDLIVSASLLPILLVFLALIVRVLDRGGWPVWGIAA